MILSSEQLADIRRVYALSQRAFAEELGVSHAYVSYMETGQRPVTPVISRTAIEKFALDIEKLTEISTIAKTFNITD